MKPPVFKLSREICNGRCRNLTLVLPSKRRSLGGRVGSRVECLDFYYRGARRLTGHAHALLNERFLFVVLLIMCFLISEYPSDVLIATFFLCLPVEDILLSDKRVSYIICKSRMIFEQAAAHFEIRRRIVLCVL